MPILVGMSDFCIPNKPTTIPKGADWLHEVRYDGYRLRIASGWACLAQQ